MWYAPTPPHLMDDRHAGTACMQGRLAGQLSGQGQVHARIGPEIRPRSDRPAMSGCVLLVAAQALSVPSMRLAQHSCSAPALHRPAGITWHALHTTTRAKRLTLAVLHTIAMCQCSRR